MSLPSNVNSSRFNDNNDSNPSRCDSQTHGVTPIGEKPPEPPKFEAIENEDLSRERELIKDP